MVRETGLLALENVTTGRLERVEHEAAMTFVTPTNDAALWLVAVRL